MGSNLKLLLKSGFWGIEWEATHTLPGLSGARAMRNADPVPTGLSAVGQTERPSQVGAGAKQGFSTRFFTSTLLTPGGAAPRCGDGAVPSPEPPPPPASCSPRFALLRGPECLQTSLGVSRGQNRLMLRPRHGRTGPQDTESRALAGTRTPQARRGPGFHTAPGSEGLDVPSADSGTAK